MSISFNGIGKSNKVAKTNGFGGFNGLGESHRQKAKAAANQPATPPSEKTPKTPDNMKYDELVQAIIDKSALAGITRTEKEVKQIGKSKQALQEFLENEDNFSAENSDPNSND